MPNKTPSINSWLWFHLGNIELRHNIIQTHLWSPIICFRSLKIIYSSFWTVKNQSYCFFANPRCYLIVTLNYPASYFKSALSSILESNFSSIKLIYYRIFSLIFLSYSKVEYCLFKYFFTSAWSFSLWSIDFSHFTNISLLSKLNDCSFPILLF